MFYSNLILNKKKWSIIKKYYTNNRLPNAFLFYGNKGIGKEGHAIEIAALINCKNPLNDEACSTCNSCIKLKGFQHPNVKFIIPYPKTNVIQKSDPAEKALNKKDLDDLIKLKHKKTKDPYQKIKLNKSNTIILNSIKSLKKELFNTNIEQGWKIVLIFEAEKLCIPTPESANAVLKLLEEPPDKTIFILVTNNFSQILDTIKSRCQCIYFNPLKFNNIKLALKDHKISDEGLKLFVKLSNGDLSYIKKILNSKQSIKENTINAFKYIYNGTLNKDDSFLKILKKDDWDLVMKILILLYRDILILSHKSNKQFITISNFYEKYISIINNNPDINWYKCIKIIEIRLCRLLVK